MRVSSFYILTLLAGCSYFSYNPVEGFSPPTTIPASPDNLSGSSPKTMSAYEHSESDDKRDSGIASRLGGPQQSPAFYAWAASEGYAQAQFIYGQHLIAEGLDKEGLEWLQKASSKNYLPASIALSSYYKNKDTLIAYGFLEPLMAQNYAPAFLAAAEIRFQENKQESGLIFLEKAANLGDLKAQALLTEKRAQEKSVPWGQVAHNIALDAAEIEKDALEWEALWPVDQPAPSTLLEKQESVLSWVSPVEFLALFQDTGAEKTPFAALQQLSLRLEYPTLLPSLGPSLSQLAHEASAIPSGAVLQSRLILKGLIDDQSREKAWANLEFAASQKHPYALFALSYQKRHLGQLETAVQLYQEGLMQPHFQEHLLHASEDLLNGFLGFYEDRVAYDSLFLLAKNLYPKALVTLSKKILDQKIYGTPEEAFLMRYQAAWQGLPMAQYLVGNMYLSGQGIEQSDERAFRWFLQSARSGYRPAQYQISQMYEKGIGTLPSLVKAYAWQSISIKGLHEEPQFHMKNLSQKLSWEQLNEALALESHYQACYQRVGLSGNQ